MGSSSSKRKESDQVTIGLIRKKKNRGGGEGGTGSGPSSDNSYTKKAIQCPAALKVRLPKDSKLVLNTELELKILNSDVGIYYHNQLIIKLSSTKTKIIFMCLDLGFKYSGLVQVDKGGKYVIFKRKSK